MGNFLVALNGAGEMAVELGLAHAPKCCLYGGDHQVGIAVGKSPERDGAILGNFGVRRAAVIRQDFKPRQMDDAMARLARDRAIEPSERFDERFGALI